VTSAPKAPVEPRPAGNPPLPQTRAPGLETAPRVETIRTPQGEEHGAGDKGISDEKRIEEKSVVKPTPKPTAKPAPKPEPEKPKDDEPQH
jgi:hypothetical protein